MIKTTKQVGRWHSKLLHHRMAVLVLCSLQQTRRLSPARSTVYPRSDIVAIYAVDMKEKSYYQIAENHSIACSLALL